MNATFDLISPILTSAYEGSHLSVFEQLRSQLGMRYSVSEEGLVHESDACIWFVPPIESDNNSVIEADMIAAKVAAQWIGMSGNGHGVIFAHGVPRLMEAFPRDGAIDQWVLVTDVQTLNRNGLCIHTAPYAFERQVDELLRMLNTLPNDKSGRLRDLASMVVFLSSSTAVIITYSEGSWDGLLLYAPNLYTAAKCPLDVLERSPKVFEGAMAAMLWSLMEHDERDDPLGVLHKIKYALSVAVHDALLLFSLALDPHNVMKNADDGSVGVKTEQSDNVMQMIIDLRDPEKASRYVHPMHVPLKTSANLLESPWSMYRCLDIGGFDIARRIIACGADNIQGLPILRRGKFLSFDQQEALSILRIEQLIAVYLMHSERDKPLNLAVFGAPGAGKSFFVKQLVAGLNNRPDQKVKIKFRTFNLSQLHGVDAGPLSDAFQKVCDDSNEESVPLLFLDEFDCDDFRWLAHFLAPMNDGQFSVGSDTKNLPRCILVFAGGVCSGIDELMNISDAKKLKSPDFVSRLHAVQTVWGVDKGTSGDEHCMYIARRAVILQNCICKLFGGNVRVDEALLYALLHVERFRHGARSMEMLCHSLVVDGQFINAACLPTDNVLELYFDVNAFWLHFEKGQQIKSNIERFAIRVHEKYCEIQNKYRDDSGTYLTFMGTLREWDELQEWEKANSFEPIWHLESRLNRLGYTLHTERQKYRMEMLGKPILDMIARQEHMRWMGWTMMCGRRFGCCRAENNKLVRDGITPFLIDTDTLMQLSRLNNGTSSFVLDEGLSKLQVELLMSIFSLSKP